MLVVAGFLIVGIGVALMLGVPLGRLLGDIGVPAGGRHDGLSSDSDLGTLEHCAQPRANVCASLSLISSVQPYEVSPRDERQWCVDEHQA